MLPADDDAATGGWDPGRDAFGLQHGKWPGASLVVAVSIVTRPIATSPITRGLYFAFYRCIRKAIRHVSNLVRLLGKIHDNR